MTRPAPAPRVIVAPDKFKGSLTAEQAADAMRRGVLDAIPSARVECIPVADGGEGTVEAFVTAGASKHEIDVSGPLGTPVRAGFAIRENVAIVESAQACGLALVARPGPRSALSAATLGVAHLVLAALHRGARRIVIGFGGSASTDGGSGLATGLGARLLDSDGQALPLGGGSLTGLDHIDMSPMIDLGGVDVLAACDVQSPLVGPHGAARTFAPQKGAGPEEVALLEAGLRRFADVVARDVGVDVSTLPGGGAAGGLGAGAVAFLQAQIVSGVDVVLDLLYFADAVAGASVVITGEGSFDVQSLTGKAPIGVARAARAAGVPVWVISGRADVSPAELSANGIAGCMALTDIAGPSDAMRDAGPLLRRRTADAMRSWLPALR